MVFLTHWRTLPLSKTLGTRSARATSAPLIRIVVDGFGRNVYACARVSLAHRVRETSAKKGRTKPREVVDAQVHIWQADTLDMPWKRGAAVHKGSKLRGQCQCWVDPQNPLTAEKLLSLMDEAGVSRAVLVPPSWAGDSNEICLAAAKAHPTRFGVMGRLDINSRRAAEAAISSWRSTKGLLGFRITCNPRSNPQVAQALQTGGLDWAFAALEKHGAPLMLYVPTLVDCLPPILTQFPKLRFVIDHCAIPVELEGTNAVNAALSEMEPLAKYPNVALKLTALPCHMASDEPETCVSLQPRLRKLISLFGAERCFWGTDLSRNPLAYKAAMRQFTEHFPDLTQTEQELVMGDGILRFLHWDSARCAEGS